MSAPLSPSAHDTTVIDLKAAHLTLGNTAASVNILKVLICESASARPLVFLGQAGPKTSLLMVMAGLENLTKGRIFLSGTDITQMDEDPLAAMRRDMVGIIFQAFRLIPSLTALQNVAIPLELAGHNDATDLAEAALESVGLEHRLTHLPDQLSEASNNELQLRVPLHPSHAFFLLTSQLETSIAQPVKRS